MNVRWGSYVAVRTKVSQGRPEHGSNSSIKEGAAVFTPPFTLNIGPNLIAVRVRFSVLSTTLHKDMSLSGESQYAAIITQDHRYIP